MAELGVQGRRDAAEIEDAVARGMEAAIERRIFVETNVPEAYYTRWPANVQTRRTRFDVFSELNALPSLFRPGFCPLVANMLTVEHDGTLLPCCRARYPLGNLHDADLPELWIATRMQRLRSTFLERRLYSGCLACRDFFSDSLHPDVPAAEDSGRTWQDDFPEAEHGRS